MVPETESENETGKTAETKIGNEHLRTAKVPSEKECEALMLEFEMPENIRAHTNAVRKVANFIAEKISENGHAVDKELVDKGAFLHDLMKMYCIKNKCRHADEGSRVLLERGYREIAGIVKQHALTNILDFDESVSLESKIVWYADKRVNHDKIVSLEDRYVYLKETYGSRGKEILEGIIASEKPAFELEEKLFEMAGVSKDLGELDG